MAPIPNPRLIFHEIPEGYSELANTMLYDDTGTIDIEGSELYGGVLVKVLALSLDPYMRNRMRPFHIPGDMPAFSLHETVTGFGVGVVLRSELTEISQGDHVYGFMKFQHYNIFATTGVDSLSIPGLGLTVLRNDYNLPWHYFLGVLGMTGHTAYYGLKDICSPKEGETLYVSAACGAVGHLVVQLAKSKGLKVIASCGSDEKVAIVKGLGADHVFNYQVSDIRRELEVYGPVDIYFDNVGGPTLEAAIEHANLHARFVICGMVSQYNTDMSKAYGVKNLWLLSRHRIRMEGLVVIDWHPKYLSEFDEWVPQEVAAGRLKYLSHVHKGLQTVGAAFADLMKGGNIGKSVVVLDDAALSVNGED